MKNPGVCPHFPGAGTLKLEPSWSGNQSGSQADARLQSLWDDGTYLPHGLSIKIGAVGENGWENLKVPSDQHGGTLLVPEVSSSGKLFGVLSIPPRQWTTANHYLRKQKGWN